MKRWMHRLLAMALATVLLLSAAGMAETAPEAPEKEEELEIVWDGDDGEREMIPEAAEELIVSPDDESLEEVLPAEEAYFMEAAEATAALAEQDRYYGRVVADSAIIYADAAGEEIAWGVYKGDVVLVLGGEGKRVRVAYAGDASVMEGYLASSAVVAMTAEEAAAYQAEAAGSMVVLYQDDINWPLKAGNNDAVSHAEKTNDNGDITTVYWVYAEYKTWTLRRLYFKKQPYASSDNAGSIFNATFKVKRFVENKYHNLWAETIDNTYVYAGYKKVNGQWVEALPDDLGQSIEWSSSLYEEAGIYWKDGNLSGKTLKAGSSWPLTGVIVGKSYFNSMPSVKVTIYESSSVNGQRKQCWTGSYDNEGSPDYAFFMGEINSAHIFETLAVGSYVLVVKPNYVVFPASGKSYDFTDKYCLEVPFKVAYGSSAPASSDITFSNVAYPSTYVISTAGYALTTGEVRSTYPLVSLKSEIVSADGQVISSYTRSISGNTYAIKNMDTYSGTDNGVRFSYIKSPGSYKWILTAKDSAGYTKTHTMAFTAVSGGSGSTSQTGGGSAAPAAVAATGVALNKKTATVVAGGTLPLSATVSPANATDRSVTWLSSNPKVATVTGEGVVRGIDKGKATITARTANGKKATCTITVPVAPTKLKLNKTKANGVVGATLQLAPKLTPTKAKTKYTLTSSDPSVATVSDKGLVKAVGMGVATITVTTANGKTATCKVTVAEPPTDIRFKKNSYSVKKGKKVTLATVLTAKSAKTAYAWSSSNKKIATVSNKGVVKGKKKGTVTITVKTANGLTASVRVKVK